MTRGALLVAATLSLLCVSCASWSGGAARTGRTWTNPRDGSVLVHVPGGAFTMGNDQGEIDERPAHEVRLAPYWMGRCKVTNAQVARFLNECGNKVEQGEPWFQGGFWKARIVLQGGTHVAAPGYGDHPAGGLTWHGARAYCEWAGLRLPTEAEWERAARGTDGRLYPWGNAWEAGKANAGREVAWADGPVESLTCAVDALPEGASPCGCLGMAGNLWEWCSSLYATYPYRASDGREDPQATGPRVMRGGCWHQGPLFARSTNRYRKFPTYFETRWFPGSCGFRVASSGEESGPTPPVEAPSATLAPSPSVRQRAHPAQLAMDTGPEVAPSADLDARYRLAADRGPSDDSPPGAIAGYPVTDERERRYAIPFERLEELVDSQRDERTRSGDVMGLMAPRPGEVVADIGAGSGHYTFSLARAVAPRGRVWATDISVSALKYLQMRLEREPQPNVRLLLHEVTDCLLPPGSVDLALVAQTQYFYYPKASPGTSPPLAQVVAFYRSVARALKPDGRLCIVEYNERHPGQFPTRGVLRAEDIIKQMRMAGFVPERQQRLEKLTVQKSVKFSRDAFIFRRHGHETRPFTYQVDLQEDRPDGQAIPGGAQP